MSAAYRCDLCNVVFESAPGAISIDTIVVHGDEGLRADIVDICPDCAPRLRALLEPVLKPRA